MAKWSRQLLLGVFIGLFGVIVNLTPLGLALEEKFGLYWLFHLRGAVTAPGDVMVVAIDQPSATALDLPITPRSWPREYHARLIEKLNAAGARVIVFDLLFDTQGKVPEDNAKLALAMQNSRNVVVVERLVFEEAELFVDSADQSYNRIIQEGPSQLLPIIADAAMAHAPFPLPKAARVNNYWTFKAGAGDVPTMPVAALQVYALQGYDDFVGLLQKVNPTYAAKLPVDKNALDVEDLIFTLRNIFVNDPQVTRLMQAALNRDTSLDATNKRIINALLNVYAGNGTRYINFYGPPRSVKTVPYYQVLQLDGNDTIENHLQQFDFKDKVVFVGFSAATQPEQDRVRDDYHTVFSNPDGLFISGVEIAATAFANLLENRPIRPFPFTGSLGLLFLLGFGMSVVFLALPNRSSIAFGCFLIFIYAFCVFYQFKQAGIWLPLIVPMFLQLPLALFGAVFLRYLDAKRERQQLQEAFGYFLPERVVNDIAKSPGVISSNNQLVYGACLATDADMYTGLAERMDPLQLSRLMNNYYAVLFEPVRQHHGIISDVVGDAMLAIWTDSAANIALQRQACLACLDIAEAVDRFNQDSDQKLPTRIGLHAGEMLLGNVGAIDHYEYRAVGDMVNTSNRIQGMNKYLGTRLLVSSAVVAGLDDFLIRPLGGFLLFGKSSSVNLAEMITHKQAASNKQLWLCEVFASALHAYQLQKWQEAIKNFSEILKAFPNDGPARFFLAHCQQLMLAPPIDLWSPTIRMEGK
jgi:adenylate cyclase